MVPAAALLCLLLAGGCRDQRDVFDGGDSWPVALGAPALSARKVRQLDNDGFIVGYDRARRRAAWVVYRAAAVNDYQRMPRPQFAADPRLEHAPALSAYNGPAYDRGHLAPNYAMSQLYGAQAQRESFYYSNVVPQRPRLNQLLWQRLEELEIDAIAPGVDPLWVMLGPIAADNASVPAAFFRIWIARTRQGGWVSLAFIVPQRVRGDERLSDFVVSIDAVESATGLDFFSGLDRVTQQALETEPAPLTTFGFAQHACTPARYAKRWQDRNGTRLRFGRCATH